MLGKTLGLPHFEIGVHEDVGAADEAGQKLDVVAVRDLTVKQIQQVKCQGRVIVVRWRHFAQSILIVGRGNRIDISAGNTVTKSEITLERNRILLEDLVISEAAAAATPTDENS